MGAMVWARCLLAALILLLTGCGTPQPISQADAARVAAVAGKVAEGTPEVVGAVDALRAEAQQPEPDLDVIRDAVADILAAAKPAMREADADPELVFLIGVLEIWLATP